VESFSFPEIDELEKEKYFITSETNYNDTARVYSIREFSRETGAVTTIDPDFSTLKEARDYLREVI